MASNLFEIVEQFMMENFLALLQFPFQIYFEKTF